MGKWVKLISGVLLFLIIFTSCSGDASESDASVKAPNISVNTGNNSEERVVGESTVSISESSVSTHNRIINEESIKLKSLEKAFMESDYYIKEHMIPLTISRDYKYFIVYKVRKENREAENELILIGMPRQSVDLYRVDPTEKKAVKLGKTEFIASHAWSEDGRLLSLVSHNSVKILDVAAGSLAEVPLKYERERIYNTNWELDNRTLNIHLDTVANYYAYDSYSKEMKKTRGGFAEGDVVYRGKAGEKILTSKGERVGVARGLYLGELPGKLLYGDDAIIHDTDQSRILVSYENPYSEDSVRYELEEYDTDTGESRVLYDEGNMQSPWKIFKASYLKTTGDVIYTTFKIKENGVEYFLVRIERDGQKSVIQVPSPLYTVTPGENLIHFAAFRDGDSCYMDVAGFQFVDAAQSKEFENKEIRELMFRVLDIYSSETPDIDKIKQVFINSYDTVPQEALENILLEAEKTWKYTKLEIGKDVTMTVKLKNKGSTASVVLNDLYFRSPHELVKKEGRWVITGLSTWPDSKVRNDVYKACTRYIENEIKTGKAKDKISTSFSQIEVGEIEIWAMSEPHRAVYPDAYAKEARVKILVTMEDGSTEKYMAYFSKRSSGGTWKCSSLGRLSAGLFPGR